MLPFFHKRRPAHDPGAARKAVAERVLLRRWLLARFDAAVTNEAR